MTLKINYLDSQKNISKNTALFLSNDSKISEFKGIFDDKTNQKILNFLKKNKSSKNNKIDSISIDFDQKIILIILFSNAIIYPFTMMIEFIHASKI